MGTPWVSFNGKDCSGCKHLNDRGYCEFTACIIPCTMRATIPAVKPQTNGDNFRAMTDEELAEFLLNRDLAIVEKASKAVGFTYKVDRESCLVNVIDWLRQEAKDGSV